MPVRRRGVILDAGQQIRLAQATKSSVGSYQDRSPDHQLNGGSNRR
jgi:hypothetical protein